ncbi:MAG: hypothetical protein AAGD11_01800 [Planctomycetota bacterium]
MRLHKAFRSWQQEIDLRRRVSDAAAAYRQPRRSDAAANQLLPSLQARLLPLDGQGRTGSSCQIEVKDFDERGITFQHQRPLHDRRALVVLEGPNLEQITAEVDLSWCRFSQRGHYTSGGRFVSLAAMSA